MKTIKKINNILILVLILTFISILNTYPNVSLKNGNFYIGYTDHAFSGGYNFDIERVYNSKSSFKGIFGYGWGYDFAQYAVVLPDGTILLHEYGGGARNIFSENTGNNNIDAFDNAVNYLTDVAIKIGKVKTPEEISEYSIKISEFERFLDEYMELLKNSEIEPIILSPGTKLESNRFGYQYIIVTENGFERYSQDGTKEYFDLKGRLIKKTDKNNNYISYEYYENNLISKITDNRNRFYSFNYNETGLVTSIISSTGKISEYDYSSDFRTLIYSKNGDSNTYIFKYDGRYNMTEILYSDNSKMQIEYYGQDANENVKRVIDRYGSSSNYIYEKGDDYMKVKITELDANNKFIQNNNYEYTFRKGPNGREWTFQEKIALHSEYYKDNVTIYTFNELYDDKPDSIRYNNEVTKFIYDDQGRLINKEGPLYRNILKYNDNVNKISYAEIINNKTNYNLITQFDYDNSGNAIFVKNSKGESMKIEYDSNRQISKLVDNDGAYVIYYNNEWGKPIKIITEVGEINVTYDEAMNIIDTKSSDRKAVLQVTTILNEFQKLIKAAEVKLEFE